MPVPQTIPTATDSPNSPTPGETVSNPALGTTSEQTSPTAAGNDTTPAADQNPATTSENTATPPASADQSTTASTPEEDATLRVWPGSPYPLGSTFDGTGTNFALFSSVAEKVELCLVDRPGGKGTPLRETRIELTELDAHIWHCYLPDVGPGQEYGFRVYGPWDPHHGLRCDPSKFLVDPYAKAFTGDYDGDGSLLTYYPDDRERRNEEDSLAHSMRSVVINPYFDWGTDHPPRHPMNQTVIYEAHVKGMTMTHPDIPAHLRGTYAGLAHPSIINYLKELGITAIELMPVHQFYQDDRLKGLGLRNYWGYNSFGFMAPHHEYASSSKPGAVVSEFKAMVRAFHEADIEVILDVVYNHTAEGNHLGPHICFRGIDNQAYYRLVPGDRQHYMDFTGTGNSMNVRHPATLQLIMDSLRYWVTEMHVDGFRFDLASTLARDDHGVNKLSTFFTAVQQDPVLSHTKLIAEPWDIGEGGYQVGNFPAGWSEWNGMYRDTVRDFWRGEPATLGEFASRLTGSSDLYESSGRRPTASINFVTAHDGFTLRDLVSYNHKHNAANMEDGRDGESHNRSWNCGVEGETSDAAITELRERQVRNFLTTLMLSQGTPMLCHGDEMGRSQGGNNNAYCQDSPLAWVDWAQAEENKHLVDFTRRLLELRRDHPVFRRRTFFEGGPLGVDVTDRDIAWLTPQGSLMVQSDWNHDFGRSLMVHLSGEKIEEPDEFGLPVVDDSFILCFNAHHESMEFTLPGDAAVNAYRDPAEKKAVRLWTVVVDTSLPTGFSTVNPEMYGPENVVTVESRSVVVLKRRRTLKTKAVGEAAAGARN